MPPLPGPCDGPFRSHGLYASHGLYTLRSGSITMPATSSAAGLDRLSLSKPQNFSWPKGYRNHQTRSSRRRSITSHIPEDVYLRTRSYLRGPQPCFSCCCSYIPRGLLTSQLTSVQSGLLFLPVPAGRFKLAL